MSKDYMKSGELREGEITKNNTKLFRKIVRKFNEDYGYSFVLPKDTDYNSKYAHPVHDDGTTIITGQIDDDRDGEYIYGLQVKKDGVNICSISPNHDGITYEKLVNLMHTEYFKYRLGVMTHLQDIQQKLSDYIDNVRSNIFDDTLHDIEREDSYDIAIQVAKELYKSSQIPNRL